MCSKIEQDSKRTTRPNRTDRKRESTRAIILNFNHFNRNVYSIVWLLLVIFWGNFRIREIVYSSFINRSGTITYARTHDIFYQIATRKVYFFFKIRDESTVSEIKKKRNKSVCLIFFLLLLMFLKNFHSSFILWIKLHRFYIGFSLCIP